MIHMISVAAIATTLMLVGCSKESGDRTPAAKAQVQPAPPATPKKPTTPDPANATGTKSADGDKSGTIAATSAPANGASPQSAAAAPSTPPGKLPPQADIKHGGTYWAVYLAVAKPRAASLAKATQRAKALGYTALAGDINCTRAVDPSAPTSDDAHLVALYFSGRAQAEQAANAYGKTVWLGRAQTYCLD